MATAKLEMDQTASKDDGAKMHAMGTTMERRPREENMYFYSHYW